MNAYGFLKHAGWTLALLASAMAARGAALDLADSPLVTSAPNEVKPNLNFVLDDSGSMDWDYMPDWVGGGASSKVCKGGASGAASYCCQSSPGGTSPNASGGACWLDPAPFGNWRGEPPFLSNDVNGVYYSPEIRYKPPLAYQNSNSGEVDTSTYPSQDSAHTLAWTAVKNDGYGRQSTLSINLLTQFPDLEWCTDGSYTDCLRNDNYILPTSTLINGKLYNVFHATTAAGAGSVVSGNPDAPTASARVFGPHYYTINPGEFCDSENLRNCQTTQTETFRFPAKLRWCSDVALTTCQAVKTSAFKYPLYPTNGLFTGNDEVLASATFTLTVTGTCNNSNKAAVAKVIINGATDILNPDTAAISSSSNTSKNSLGLDLASKITNGYTAVRFATSPPQIRITAASPGAAYNIASIALVKTAATSSSSCLVGVSGPVYTDYRPAVPKTWYGGFARTDIVPGSTYPKGAPRSDCAGAVCTYAEEMTNFANWWAYYHTRMQMMKTATSAAFGPVDSNYRVGFFTINTPSVATGANFLNVNAFDFTGALKQKYTWYTKLFAAVPSGSTPLRGALTKAGRIYGGRIGVNPVQYSCQQNFTLLSTDGYWNETNPGGYQLDGSTAVGNQDGSEARPMLDGNNQSNTLADVAEYYYATDLRTAALGNCTGAPVPPAATGNTLCSSDNPDPFNNVPTGGRDTASWQHMTTFTLGLGASGFMQYQSDYLTAASGDFFDVKNGSLADPAHGICTWQASGECNWPNPVNNSQPNIDDLWHAAVNGRGAYFSATNPASLAAGLESALAILAARNGAAAAATTSNPNVTSGDNFVFSSTFTSVEWSGELVRQQLDLNTGAVPNYKPDDHSTYDWAARDQLDSVAYAGRRIYAYLGGALTPFTWAGLDAASQAYFLVPHISTAPPVGMLGLSQFCATGVECLSAEDQDSAHAAGQNLVNFLRGDRGHEGSVADTSKYYRQRAHALGDLVNAEAVYVRGSLFDYADSGYSDFKDGNNSGRHPVVYAAANDGMLHAFDGDNGSESWAYIPSLVLPNLYALADKRYALGDRHRFFVDGTPTTGDMVCSSPSCGAGSWRTVLIGGLNGGGRGYYALDVTTPAATPTVMWEFTDANMGYTYGNPVIAKLTDGTWVALVTSGYNNVPPYAPAGDGAGRLYVLNASTGALIRSISTGVGGTGTVPGCDAAPCPSGLGRINAWVDNPASDNTALRVYGGDMFGNLWRFDPNRDQAADNPQLLATFKDSGGKAQPVTTKPELGDVNGNSVVFVGTGRYLGVTDISDKSPQTFYAVKDNLGSTSYGDPRSGGFIEQTLTATTCPAGSLPAVCGVGQPVRTGSSNPVNFAVDNGWYIDLPDEGERANTDPALALGTLVFTTNVPSADACSAGGYSYRYFLDYRTGAPLLAAGGQVVGERVANALATRAVVAALPNHSVIDLVRLSTGETINRDHFLNNAPGPARRVSWRELVNDR
jgi:type IV pilus assembly protein PilY1